MRGERKWEGEGRLQLIRMSSDALRHSATTAKSARKYATHNGECQQQQRGGVATSRRANQSETKLITLRGNVITKIFSPSSAARRATKCHLSSLVCATRGRQRQRELKGITPRLPWVRPGLMCGPQCARLNATNNMLHVIK